MLEYQIISKNSTEELEKEVRVQIESGWKPLGGVSVVVRNLNVLACFQAMVRQAQA